MLAKILQTVRKTQSDLETLTIKFNEIESAVAYNSNDIAEQRAENAMLKEDNTRMKSRVSQIEDDLASMKMVVKSEAMLRNENENNSRKYNLEFSGVPKDEDEQRDMPRKQVVEIMKLMIFENNSSL